MKQAGQSIRLFGCTFLAQKFRAFLEKQLETVSDHFSSFLKPPPEGFYYFLGRL